MSVERNRSGGVDRGIQLEVTTASPEELANLIVKSYLIPLEKTIGMRSADEPRVAELETKKEPTQ